MSAGESAYDVARKKREKAERLQRSAALWERGAAGEVEVARSLDGLPDGWISLHDLAWPGRPRANIDHVVIGPNGVFVVDAKNWSGTVEVRDQVLRQNGRQRERTVASAAEAAVAVQGILPVPHLCLGVLCFVRDEALTGWARDVMVCSTGNILALLTSRPVALDAADVERCAAAVRLMTASETHRSTSRSLSAPTGTTPVGPRVPRRTRLVVLKAVVAVLLLGVLLGGGATKLGEWTSKLLVQQVTPSGPVEPMPVPKDKRTKQPSKKKDASPSPEGAG